MNTFIIHPLSYLFDDSLSRSFTWSFSQLFNRLFCQSLNNLFDSGIIYIACIVWAPCKRKEFIKNIYSILSN